MISFDVAAGRALDNGISWNSCSENLVFSAENDIAIDDGYTLFNVVGYLLLTGAIVRLVEELVSERTPGDIWMLIVVTFLIGL